MGGTIRTVLNVSGYLAANGWDVEILGTYRRRKAPFFGDFPPGVKVTALDDQRGKANPLVRRLRGMRSVLLNRSDRLFDAHSLLTDIRLARALRGRTGFLMGTRPALNLLAAQLAQPGLVAIGQEHMNYRKNSPPLRRAIASRYPALDALVVLTEDDKRSYSELFDGAVEVVAIPNAVPELGGELADLSRQARDRRRPRPLPEGLRPARRSRGRRWRASSRTGSCASTAPGRSGRRSRR